MFLFANVFVYIIYLLQNMVIVHFFVPNKQALQNAILHMFRASGVLPGVLPFTRFYPITQGKTVQRFYPPTWIKSRADAVHC